MTLTIHPVRPSDKDQWLPLWRGYLAFYHEDLPQEITNQTWDRILDEGEQIYCLGGYSDGEMVAFATYVLHRSTWSASTYCYLEDLFVADSQRGKGVGRQMIEAIAQAARDHGSTRLYWNTNEANKTAQALYDRIATKTDVLQYRKAL
jgi:GNAT superfamily N-acetyltransferase